MIFTKAVKYRLSIIIGFPRSTILFGTDRGNSQKITKTGTLIGSERALKPQISQTNTLKSPGN